RSRNATNLQDAHYRGSLAGARSINRERVAAWQAAVARALLPWQAQVITQLQRIATRGQSVGTPDLSASIQAAVTTLGGLAGRRVLLLLGPGPSGPPAAAMPRGSLVGVHLVVANLADPNAAAAEVEAGRLARADDEGMRPRLGFLAGTTMALLLAAVDSIPDFLAAQAFGLDQPSTIGITAVLVAGLACAMWATAHYHSGWRRLLVGTVLGTGLVTSGLLLCGYRLVKAGDA